MAVDNFLQLAIIGVIIIVFVIYGPKKIPELARALGQAKKEFSDGTQQSGGPGATASPPPDELIATARKLGISTEGKTKGEISDEIVKRAQSKA